MDEYGKVTSTITSFMGLAPSETPKDLNSPASGTETVSPEERTLERVTPTRGHLHVGSKVAMVS